METSGVCVCLSVCMYVLVCKYVYMYVRLLGNMYVYLCMIECFRSSGYILIRAHEV